MQLTNITCLLLFLSAAQWALADEESSTDTNEIIPREAIQKLDFSVRLALLRAIDKLEQEASEGDDDDDNGEDKADPSTIIPSRITIQSTTALPLTKDEVLEESTSSSDIFPTVQFFTATYDEKNAHEQPLAVYIDKSKNKVIKNLGSPEVVSTNIQDETKNINPAARSVANANVQSNEILLNGLDEIKFEIRNTKNNQKATTTFEANVSSTTTTTTTSRPRTTRKRTTTTSTTTTTTTPRPTHNEDGENIEVVAKDDIRIQAAPLISAFTVDLDESGTAKKVRPIIHSPPSTAGTIVSSTQKTSSILQQPLFGPTITELNVLPADAQRSAAFNLPNNLASTPVPLRSTFSSSTESNTFSNVLPTSGHFITKQPLTSNINPQQQSSSASNFLLEKQRELEQQIYQLKLQAQQQQELIIRQLKLLEEQANKQQNNPQTANSLIQLASVQQLQQQQQPQHLSLVQKQQQQQQQEPGFTIRPSIEFIPSTQSKLVPIFPSISLQQQLPLKESNGKYINGVQRQQNNLFSNSIVQPQQKQQHQQPQQRLPIENNPVQQIFQKLQNLQKFNTQAASSISSIQIQPSNQLNIVPTFASLLPEVPPELSLVQALPQRNYQQFQQNPLVPQYVTTAVLERQQQQQQEQQQQNRARLFRQEGDTANFGINQQQIQPNNNIFSSYNEQQQLQQQSANNIDNQNFYRQHLIPAFSNQLQQNVQQFYQQQPQQNSQTAFNHGINNFAPQSLLSSSQSTAQGTQPIAQTSHFNTNIF